MEEISRKKIIAEYQRVRDLFEHMGETNYLMNALRFVAGKNNMSVAELTEIIFD